MTRMTPFDDVNRMFDRMYREFDEAWGEGWGGFDAMGRASGVDVDVAEYDDEIVVVADLPGFEKDDIDLSIREDTLTISAERTSGREESESGAYLRRERRVESVRRRIALPAEVHEEDASATYSNGVLTVTLPKVTVGEAGEEGHHIDVS